MSFQAIAHDPRPALAKRTGKVTLIEKEAGHRPVKLMTCTRRRPYEGHKYARCAGSASAGPDGRTPTQARSSTSR